MCCKNWLQQKQRDAFAFHCLVQGKCIRTLTKFYSNTIKPFASQKMNLPFTIFYQVQYPSTQQISFLGGYFKISHTRVFCLNFIWWKWNNLKNLPYILRHQFPLPSRCFNLQLQLSLFASDVSLRSTWLILCAFVGLFTYFTLLHTCYVHAKHHALTFV